MGRVQGRQLLSQPRLIPVNDRPDAPRQASGPAGQRAGGRQQRQRTAAQNYTIKNCDNTPPPPPHGAAYDALQDQVSSAASRWLAGLALLLPLVFAAPAGAATSRGSNVSGDCSATVTGNASDIPGANRPAGDPVASCPPLLANATAASTPTKITGVGVASHDRALVVTWDAQTNRAYNVQWKTSSQNWGDNNQDHTILNAATTYKIPSLTNNTEYSVRVRARDFFNVTQFGPWSDTATGTPATPPKITGVKVAPRDGALAVSWSEQTGRTYNVQWKSGNQGWIADHSQDGITTTTHPISSLTNNTEYSVRVRARDAFNTSVYGAWSDIVKATPADEILTVSNISTTSATLTIGNYGGTWYYKYINPAGGTCSSAVNTASATVSDLLRDRQYQFRAYSDSSCSTTLATGDYFSTLVEKVTGVSVAVRDRSLVISWTPVSYNTQYVVQWKSGAQEWARIAFPDSRQIFTASGASSATISNLTNDTEYTVRVNGGTTAVSTNWSDTVTGTPAAETLAASSVEATTATLTIGNYGAAWYHKYTTPTTPAGSCSSVVAAGTATADLTGLAGNTSYTYKAYSDSGCTTELATAAAFLTKPAKPTGFTVTRSGSGELTLKATVGGAGTIDKWQFQQKTDGSFGNWTDVTSATTISLTHPVSNLTNGTAYTFKVRACNGNQSSGCNGVASDASTAIAPAAATLAASNVQSTTATLAIGIHTGNWYYKYTSPTTPAGSCSSVVSSGTTTASLTGLAPYTSYTFKAYSDSTCATELTNDTSDAEFTTKIGKVTGVQVAPRHQSLAVSWNAVDGATTYYVHFKPESQNWDPSLVLSKIGGTSLTIDRILVNGAPTPLTNGVTYSVRVQAARGYRGPYSDVVTATPATQVPDKPSAPTLTDGSNDGELNVAWTAPGNGGDAITGYGVQYRLASADKSTAWTALTHSGTGTTATITGLTGGANYDVQVQATNSVGSSAWSDAATRRAPITTAVVPPKPATPDATAGNASVTLTWRSGGNGGSAITSWEYSQAVKPSGGTFSAFGSWTTISGSGASTTSATISSLTNGSTYKFKVRAVNSNGDGAASAESNEATAAVATLAASNITATGATLTLGIHTAAWHYKQTVPTAGSCSSEVTAGTKTATVTGLASNTSYTFKAYSDSSCSNANELAVAPAFLTVPAKPGTLTATATGNGAITIAASVTGGTLSKWQVQRAERAAGSSGFGKFGDWSNIANSTGTTLSHAVTGLTVGSAYRFKVRAVNTGGTGAPSDASTAVTATDGTPPAPTGLTQTANTVPGVALTWTSGGNGGAAISKWQVARKQGSAIFGAWSDICVTATNAACPSVTSHTVTNLTHDTRYSFKVRAVNSRGNGTESTATGFVPDAPDRPTLTVPSNGSFTVTWSAPNNGGPDISGYVLRYFNRANARDSGTSVNISGGGTTSHTITGLTKNNRYTVQIRAVNSAGSGWWSLSTAGTKPSSVTLNATSRTDTSATLTLSGHTTAWYHKRTAGTPADSTCHAVAAGTASASLTGLTPGTEYTHKAYSDSACTSANELAAESFTTRRLRATNVTDTGATIALTLHSGSWWHKPTAGHTASCAKATTSVALTNLATGTEITWNAYSDSTCATRIASVTFITRGLAASAVEAATATLTISGHTADWYYQANAGPDAACQGPVNAGTATKALTGLAGNTSYTYKAYSTNRNCSDTNLLATAATFLTKPAKPATPTVTTNVGSGTLRLTSSVTGGSGALSKWQYQQAEKPSGNTTFGNYGIWTNITSATTVSLSHTVTGLTNGTEYRFKVRAVNTTGTGATSDASTAASPAAPSLGPVADSVEVTAATLAIGNWSAAWYHKRTAPTGNNTCTAVTAGTTTAPLTNLAGNTNYTYKAYSDSSCSNANELAVTSAFLTKPGAPATPTVSGDGSEKLKVTSSVIGSGAITGWQVQRADKPPGNTIFGNFGSWTSIDSTASASQSLSGTVSGLTNGTEYKFKVRAVNATGEGAASNESNTKAPADRTLNATSVEANTATLGIVGHATAWYYKRTAGTPADTTCSPVAAGTASKGLTNLSSNTAYTYTAFSDATCTTANQLATASFSTKPRKADRPTVTTNVGSGTITIASSVGGNNTGSVAISKWQYQQAEKPSDSSNFGNFGSWSDITTATTVSLSHTVTGLTDGTAYKFKVRAVNATGEGAASNPSSTATPADEMLKVTAVEATTATLTISNYTLPWHYKYTAPTTPEGTCSDAVAAGTATADLTGLSGNTSYTFKAYSDSACSDTKELAVTSAFLTKPAKPTTPTVSATGSGKLLLSATVGGSGDISKWQVQRADKPSGNTTFGKFGSWRDIPSSTSTSLSHTVTGLTNGTEYQFKVRACNNSQGDCNGITSDESTALAPANRGLTASAVEATTATLTINGYTSAWHYKRTAGTPADTTCNAVAANTTTADLTGLSSNTSYTYKAYSDSTCTDANEVGGTTILTKPAKAVKPMVRTNVGSGKLTIVSSVTGSGTLERWEYIKKDGTNEWETTWTRINNATTTSLTHTVTGLTNGTEYKFKVRAVNATGNGAESDESDGATPANRTLEVPSSTLGVTGATLKIVGYSGSWYYKANVGPDSSRCSDEVTATTAELTGLSSNTNYTYTAYSDSGCTEANKLVTASFLTKPAKPTNLVAGAAGSGKLLLVASVGGDGAISTWQYVKKEGTSAFETTWTDIPSSTSRTLGHTVTGLTDGTNYQFKVRAVNATGPSAESDASDAVSPSESAPTLEVISPQTTTATLTFNGHTGQWWYRANTGEHTDCQGPVTGTANLTGLEAGTTYIYWAYTSNDACIGDPTPGTFASTTSANASNTTPGEPVAVFTTLSATSVPSNRAPEFPADASGAVGAVGAEPVVAKEGEPFSYTLPAATDPDGDTLTYTAFVEEGNGEQVQLLPGDDFWLDFDPETRTFSGTPREEDTPATLKIQVTASDGKGGSASVTFTITVEEEVNHPPTFAAAVDQTAREDEPFSYTLPAATDPDGDTLTYEVALIGSSSSELPGWLSFTIDDSGITFSGTPLEEDTPDTLKIEVTASDGEGGSASVTFTLTVEEVNDPPEFKEEAADQTATEGKAFRYQAPIATDPDHAEEDLVYTAFVEQADGELAPLPGWLTFDGDTRMFSGTPGQDDARQTHTILVKVTDPKNLSATTTFQLRVETLYNSRLPQVARQWLARFGRTVSSQVTQSITDRMGDDGTGGRITVNGQTVNLSASGAAEETSAGEAAGEADDSSNVRAGLNGTDPFATVAPTTKEAVDEEPVKATATTRDLLLGSSFRLPLNPGSADNRPSGSAKAAGGERASDGQGINSALGAAGSGGASGSVASATTASGGGGGGWTVWGEAALTNFDSTVEDVRMDGEVLTGVAALDWERERWLVGVALSQSEGEGTFDAPRTDRDDAIKGTMKSSLTAVHPYVRYRPSAGLEFWGVAGYGRGTMTLDADDEAAANPDIWLSTIGIGGRSALLTAEQTGGLELDLTADALLTRTGAAADVPLRDAVEASTTRVRVGVESAWPWQNADGTSVVPSLSSALRYDTGDAETGLGVEVGAGVAYTNPGLGLTLSADVRGLLSRQAGDGELGLREWGGSGSVRYDHGGDGLGLTASLSPSWGVAGSAKDQLWSEIAPPFPTAQGDASADASGDSGGNDAMRLEGEIGYGFAAFSGNAVITPYGGLSLSDGSRDWRLGGRLTFSPGLDISIEGTRKEQPNNAPDHGVQLDLNTAW